MNTLRQDSQITNNQVLAIVVPLIILGIPFFLPEKSSVLIDALCWATGMLLASTFLIFLSPRRAHLYLFLAVSSWLIFGVGLAEFSATLLWLVSAWSLGVLLLAAVHSTKNLARIGATEALLVGVAVWLAVWGGMLHFAINYRFLHVVLCLLPCLLLAYRFPAVRNELHSKADAAQQWMRSIPWLAWSAGLTVVGWVLRWTSFPSVGYDDHALHLRMWTELLTQQHYTFDIHAQIWSVAPFAVDLLHAILSLMAGNDARGALNLALAALLLLLMARIFSIWKLAARAQWLLIVLMTSTPMLGNLLLSLQTELALAVLAVAGMRLVIDAKDGWRGKHTLGVLSCAAMCAGIKLPGAVLGVALLAALAIRVWNQRGTSTADDQTLRWTSALLLVPLCFTALHSYVLAWEITGNPVFPLYNAIFLSPHFAPNNFTDTRWIHGFNFSSYFEAFFHTSKFFEGGDYTAGWQYLLLLPLAIVAAMQSGMPHGMRLALIPLLGFGLTMFSATQYWRYLFPAMPIAGIIFAALFIRKKTKFQAFIAALAFLCIALNLGFFTKISWLMKSPPVAAITDDERNDIMRIYAPAALLTERANYFAPGSKIVYPTKTPFGATLQGTPLYVNWYNPSKEYRFASLKKPEEVRNFLLQEKVDFVITNMSDTLAQGSPESLLREYLATYGSVVAQESTFLLHKVSETPVLYKTVFNLESSANKTPGEPELFLPISPKGVKASTQSQYLAVAPTYRAKQARYRVEFNCSSANGFFIAQINWDKGDPYYRLVSCTAESSSFTEAIPVPTGTSQGIVYVSARDVESVYIQDLSVEIH